MNKDVKSEKLYQGESVSCMPPPNHLLPIEARPQAAEVHYRWPLAMAMRTTDQGLAGVFVADNWDKDHWTDWAGQPPTWMDPHLFVAIALQDERVQRVLRVSFKKNDPQGWKHLAPLLQDIFVNVFQPQMQELFEQQAKPLLAQWMIRNNAEQQLSNPPSQTPGA
jgi:hypothetical protein